MSFGSHSVLVSAPKYRKEITDFVISDDQPTTIEVRLQPKSKGKARLLSTFVPGMGQFYADNHARGLFFLAVAVGTGWFLNSSYSDYRSENRLLDRYQSDYLHAVELKDIEQKLALYHAQVGKVNDLQSQMTAYGIALSVSWLANVIDAYFFHGLPEE